jgi:NADH-quinone oxidoreductase subunit A
MIYYVTDKRGALVIAEFGSIGLFLIVAILFSATAILLPVTLRFIKVIPQKPNPVKGNAFECGMETIGKSWVQFNFRYYYYALVFLALDVLVVFIYPWAVGLRKLGFTGLIAIIVLVATITVGYLYAWGKRVLEWK